MPDGIVRGSRDSASHRLLGLSRTLQVEQQEPFGKVRFTSLGLQRNGPIEHSQGLLALSSLGHDAGHMGQHAGVIRLSVGYFLRIPQGVRHVPKREMQRGEPGLDRQGCRIRL